MPRLKPHERLRIASMGKLHDVTAIFAGGFVDDRVDATNAYLAKNPDEGVIAEIAGVTFIASLHGGERYMTTDRHVGPAETAEELLSALNALLPVAEAFEKQASRGAGGRRGGAVFARARAAIAKAEGR